MINYLIASGPIVWCKVCKRAVHVDIFVRGFPPDVAKRKLIKACSADGHDADPQYRAGTT